MASSRIFVRGLPPNFGDEEFRRHFSHQSSQQIPVTDTRIFPERRIGFVGYKTPEDAAKAVKYFNKSYIRLSCIQVELAEPVRNLSMSSVPVADSFCHSFPAMQIRPRNLKLPKLLKLATERQ